MRTITMVLLTMTTVWATPGAVAASKQPSEREDKETAVKERKTKERAAKKACLASDPAKGVEILAELYVDTNDITYIFNQGRCFQQNRRYEDAVGRFREYLLKGEEKLSDAEKAVATKQIETCESYLPKREPPAPSYESAPVAQLPPPRPVEATAALAVATPRRSQSTDRSGLRVAGIVVTSLGAAAVVSGVLLNLKVNRMASDLEKPESFRRDLDSTRKTYKTLSWVSYGAGAAGLAIGAVLCYLGWRPGRGEADDVALVPVVGPDAAGAAWRGAF
jgi:hypothetical protein